MIEVWLLILMPYSMMGAGHSTIIELPTQQACGEAAKKFKWPEWNSATCVRSAKTEK